MNQSLIVRGAPQEYECRVGAWDDLEEHLNRRKIKRVMILHGKDSWEAAKPYFPSLVNIDAFFIEYGGECTDEKTSELKKIFDQKELEGIIAVGGGKIADLGKAVANQCNTPILILPTLAATCAAYTPLSVIYKMDGSMDRYDVFPQSNALVLIEPNVILASPIDLMIAGIGDTVAKWYEADAMISQLEIQPIEIQVSAFAAKKCRDVLLTDSQEALNAMREQEMNQAFLNVVETNILLGGMVGGFGDDYGRTAGAHSIHDALTILPESHQQLHGNKVAYGVLVQLVIENKWSEIEQLIPFYHSLDLPISLKEMKMNLSEDEYNRVAERAAEPHETIHYMKETITSEIVKTAMMELETAMSNK
ncbi:iron-containing alcohol dehydrogenase family protein [Enterococcus caccae]|uniref:Oxidoreductase n=1 Tax=Enterococcus caccae ATCC BAA-1240 TaxID=1158612 RepID=R3WIP2_9ENTE|nr:iron-containing alcohol dehydrogenase family protein [Enterococcus caccae]EOL47716.1 oxidoreductase [Enterococcus caccae ATCC BAA-1240]EOT65514.1 oxidoreductase [Enterococcus caccae ATCC BAA-1240]OJG27305.1 oxidoreductase [Enterococcus caccae]